MLVRISRGKEGADAWSLGGIEGDIQGGPIITIFGMHMLTFLFSKIDKLQGNWGAKYSFILSFLFDFILFLQYTVV